MKVLNEKELSSIKQIFQLNQPMLKKVMAQYLNSKYEKVFNTTDYVIALGDIPVALVAHLDTVFPTPPDHIYYDTKENVMWSTEGLGADDRAGIYAIIQILKAGYKPTIILTTDEEKGGVGAFQLVEDFEKSIVELKYIIELDRRGIDDCVFYDCDNEEFEKYVESFGFVTRSGTFSDISVICPEWEIAGVNLSTGYFNEHSYSEILSVECMLNTIEKVKKMLDDIENASYYKYIPCEYSYAWPNKSWWKKYDSSYGFTQTEWQGDKIKCLQCEKLEYDYNLLPIKTPVGETIHLCPDCYANRNDIHWCSICNEAFIYNNKTSDNKQTCPDCSQGVSHNV